MKNIILFFISIPFVVSFQSNYNFVPTKVSWKPSWNFRNVPSKNNNHALYESMQPIDTEIETDDSIQLQSNNVKEKNDEDRTFGLATSILLLNCVAIIWGSQHAVIKMIINDTDASYYTLLRFGLAALLASPYTPGFSSWMDETSETKNNMDDGQIQKAWRWGLEMGLWMFLGFSFQAIGLETTTASRSGFLLYLNVKFVPFFAWLILEKEISVSTWLSAFVAFLGTALLATDGVSLGFNVGDLWSIAAAASSAMFILRLEKASTEVEQSSQLNAACLWVVTLLSATWVYCQDDGLSLTTMKDLVTSHPIELIYLGGVTTALANYIQTIAQKEVSAERASVIYSLDPVYGAFFSWLLLNESLGGMQAYIGAVLITIAAAVNAFVDFGKENDDKGVNI